jgi:S-adenosylmethionine:tRNA ribosyltransferase-isomerase
MKLSDFDFDLPDDLIALRPVKPRSASRLLVSDGGDITHGHFSDLPCFLQAGDRLVLNDTKVIPARLFGRRRRMSDNGETFANVEVTLLSPDTRGRWLTLSKPGRKLGLGEMILFSDTLSATIISKSSEGTVLEFNKTGDAFDAELEEIGKMPLPPYIAAQRPADDQDAEDYQTLFAEKRGAVAAPTASLHFDTELMQALAQRGVEFTKVTLHVGAGTFLPVKVDDVSDHKMHSEWGSVSAKAATEIAQTKAEGGRVIPVGTTSLRILETAAMATGQVTEWAGDTDIFIKPGFKFHVTDGLITNFHLPKSTLLMLVSALIGTQQVRKVYQSAISRRYRFFSYGDGSLLLP